MNNNISLRIIQPDDWHIHLREGNMMRAVINDSYRFNKRCIVMPNLEIPIINSKLGLRYLKEIYSHINNDKFRFPTTNSCIWECRAFSINSTCNDHSGYHGNNVTFLFSTFRYVNFSARLWKVI